MFKAAKEKKIMLASKKRKYVVTFKLCRTCEKFVLRHHDLTGSVKKKAEIKSRENDTL